MPDPFVREIGRLEDIDGKGGIIVVDYDAVSVFGWRFNFGQCEELQALISEAYEAAAANWEKMRAADEHDWARDDLALDLAGQGDPDA